MSDIFTQVVGMIIGTVLLGWFGLGGGHRTVTVVSRTRQSKKWKLAIIFGILMILGGAVIFSNNYPLGGFNNPYSGLGFSLAFLGVVTYLVGKFGVWWNR
ncbi:hypothetical protein KC865_03630 [Candidatus Kaiserbacteria bacterium]|nr:hypothetical protein [Candidatus Kaiserbacteria bacterium]USN91947.1 MAG: hypothetical protein H6782_03670 [Candidatus Nomurabacteria bacterium]